MDVQRALNADVPQLLFTVLHQAGPTIADEDFTRTVTALLLDIRQQAQEVGEKLQQWLQQQARQEAEETARKLQRLGLLALLLSEREAVARLRGALPVLLLDDVMSELDHERRHALASRLRRDGGQAVITASEHQHVPGAEASDVAVLDVATLKRTRPNPHESDPP